MSYLKNAWYCAGFSHELGDTPLALTVLGELIVIYRLPDKTPVALADRCPHRFAPLSKGRVSGETLQCGYHGLQFGPDGLCRYNPHGNHAIPRNARVAAYPMVERDSLLWIWMGETSLARPEEAPDFGEFLNMSEYPTVRGSYKLDAHYELVIDNLLDLSHGMYLHKGTLTNGEEDADRFHFDMKEDGGNIAAYHSRLNVLPAPFFKKAWTRSARVDHHSDMFWSAPSNLRHDVGIAECGRPNSEGIFLHVVHLLTPISENETRYCWIASRNFAFNNEAASQALYDAINRAFTQEDEPMIAAVYQRMASTDLLSLKPILLPGDAAGVRARRVLNRLKSEEQPQVPKNGRPAEENPIASG